MSGTTFLKPKAPSSQSKTNTSSLNNLNKAHSLIISLPSLTASDAQSVINSIRHLLPETSCLSLNEALPNFTGTTDQAVADYTDRVNWLLEVFCVLFQLNTLTDPSARSALSKLHADLFRHGRLVDCALQGISKAATYHASLIKSLNDSANQGSIDQSSAMHIRSKRKCLLALCVHAREQLSNLIHSAIKLVCPDMTELTKLVDVLAQLDAGDLITLPLLMATLAGIRIFGEQGEPGTSAVPPTNVRMDAKHADFEQFRNKVNTINFTNQSSLKYVLMLSISIAMSPQPHSRLATQITDRERQLTIDAFKSEALPWLLTHVVANIPRPYDPIGISVDMLYKSVSKESFPIVRYPLSVASLDLARRELANFAAGSITRCSGTIYSLREADDRKLEEFQHANSESKLSTSGDVRCDFEIICLFVGLVFEGHVSDCRAFWTGELAQFLGMTVKHCRLHTITFHLVSCLVSDEVSASRCYERTSMIERTMPPFTWIDTFNAIRHYIEQYKLQVQKSGSVSHLENVAHVPSHDADRLVAALRLVRQVVKYDAQARRQILLPAALGELDALSLLFTLLTCTVPIRVKAALMDTIAAFVAPNAGMPVDDHINTATRVWSYMESVALVPQAARAMGTTVAGLLQDLEDRETPLQQFPVTAAYLNLLRNLASTSSNTFGNTVHSLPASHVSASPLMMFESLGSGHRTPGTSLYFDYMVRDVFLKAVVRDYADSREMWAIVSTSLSTIYNCLVDFDRVTKELMAASSDNGKAISGTAGSIRASLSHPAFFMLSEILDGKPLLDGILNVITSGRGMILKEERVKTNLNQTLTIPQSRPTVEAPILGRAPDSRPPFPSGGSQSALGKTTMQSESASKLGNDECTSHLNWFSIAETNEFRTALLLSFRIIYLVLCMQSRFLHELLPSMWAQDRGIRVPVGTSSKRELDQLLATRQPALIDIVSLVNGPDPNLGILSVKILAMLSLAPSNTEANEMTSNAISPLVSLLSMSEPCKYIVQAYEEQFRNIQDQQVSDLMYPSLFDVHTVHSVRVAILDLVASNLRQPQIPSLAHFLLGLTRSGQLFIGDKVTTEGTLLSTILASVIPSGGKADVSPVLAERAYEIVYRLMFHPATSTISAMLMSQAYFPQLITYWLSPDHLPIVENVANSGSSFSEQFVPFYESRDSSDPFSVFSPQANLRSSMMAPTPAKKFLLTPVSSRSQFFHRGSLSIATPGGWRGSICGVEETPLYSSNEASLVTQQILTTLGTWTWLLQSLSVQIKAHKNQASYLTTLIRDMFVEPRAPSRMVQTIKAAMTIAVPEPSGVSQEARMLAKSMAEQACPVIVEKGVILFDLHQAEQLCIQHLANEDSSEHTQTLRDLTTPITRGDNTRSPDSPSSSNLLAGVLQILLVENHRRRVFMAQLDVVRAWVDCVNTSLLCADHAFGTLESTCSLVLDLLNVVREFISVSPVFDREPFSKCMLLLLRVASNLAVQTSLEASMMERLLEVMIDVILDPNSTLIVRGNLYASLLVHFGLTTADPVVPDFEASIFTKSINRAGGISSSSSSSFGSSVYSQASIMASMDPIQLQAKDSAMRLVRKLGGAKLLNQIVTDAQSKSIWVPVSMSLLDVLCQWSMQIGGSTWVHEFLQTRGYLTVLVDMVRGLSPALIEAASVEDPTPNTKLCVVVFEYLITLLLRLCMHRQTRSVLIEAGLVFSIAECPAFTYRVGWNINTIPPSALRSSTRISGMDNSTSTRQADPYQYYAGLLPEARVSPTLATYNRILMPALGLFVALVTLHPIQVAPGASLNGTTPSGSILAKSVAQFVDTHGSSLTRVVRGAVSLLGHRQAADDERELDVTILCASEKIACLVWFLAKNRTQIPVELSQALMAFFVHGAQGDLPSKSSTRRSTISDRALLNTMGHIVNYCFTLVFEPSGHAEPIQSSRFMFDVDMSVAQNKYYAQKDRPTVGGLTLFIQQIIGQHQLTLSVLREVTGRLEAGVVRSSSEDWEKYVLCGNVGYDVASQVEFHRMPEVKRTELLQRKMMIERRQLEVETASHIRMLETAMAVLIIHLRPYESGNGENSEENDKVNKNPYARRTIRQMSSVDRKDAQDVLVDLRKSIEEMVWGIDDVSSKSVLLEMCRQAIELVSNL